MKARQFPFAGLAKSITESVILRVTVTAWLNQRVADLSFINHLAVILGASCPRRSFFARAQRRQGATACGSGVEGGGHTPMRSSPSAGPAPKAGRPAPKASDFAAKVASDRVNPRARGHSLAGICQSGAMTDTTRLNRCPMIAVRTLRVEVLAGPDVGKTMETADEVLTVGTAPGNGLRLTDDTVSRFHLELAGGANGISVSDLGSSNGTASGPVHILRGVIASGAELTLGKTRLSVRDGNASSVEVYADEELGELKGKTEVMRRLMAQVNTAARSTVPVLVIGESGTGKELVARALHHSSPRAAGPFVTLDCGALAPNLIASELFGHERGAFTGADRQHIGAFERATGGTLFLDEIGELPADLQPQLLGALERKRFRRVGGRNEIDVDVRIVCATNRDLRAEVNASVFRLDLYYRIAVVVLRIPALRERAADIPILAAHFLRECGHDEALEELLPEAMAARLQAHRWPGNVRELRNWIEATVAMGESPPLSSHELPPSAAEQPEADVYALSYKDARRTVLEAFELRYVTRLLASTGGNVAQAARQAQMDRTYLIKLVQRHGLRTR